MKLVSRSSLSRCRKGIYITTPDGSILDVNPALVRMLGYDSKEEVLKRRVPEIFVDRTERKSIKDQVERQPMIQGQEITLIRKERHFHCVPEHGCRRSRQRRPRGALSRALMDITERREMERRLHQHQEFTRRLVDSFPDLILVWIPPPTTLSSARARKKSSVRTSGNRRHGFRSLRPP